MLKKTVMLFLAVILLVGASAGFAAEKANGKTGKAVKTEHSKYPVAYEKAMMIYGDSVIFYLKNNPD